MNIETARELLSVGAVAREVYDGRECYVLYQTVAPSKRHKYLDYPKSGVAYESNYLTLRDEFYDYGWSWVMSKDGHFSVPVDSPDEAIISLADAFEALRTYPILDKEAWLEASLSWERHVFGVEEEVV